MCLQQPALMLVVMVVLMVVMVDATESGIAFAFLVQYYCQLCFFFPERRGWHVGFLLLFLLFLFFCFWFLFLIGKSERV
jgi:hypothetical protein